MRPFDIANQWAGSVGGPIKRGKLFFFFDTEGLRVLIPQVFPVTIPSLEFEAATMRHIDQNLGTTSVAFYQKIFAAYNAAPGANAVSSGGFGGDGCSGRRPGDFWAGRTRALRRRFPRRGFPSSDTHFGSHGLEAVRGIVCFFRYSTIAVVIRFISIPSVLCLMLRAASDRGKDCSRRTRLFVSCEPVPAAGTRCPVPD